MGDGRDPPTSDQLAEKSAAEIARLLDAKLDEITAKARRAKQPSSIALSRYEGMSKITLNRVIAAKLDKLERAKAELKVQSGNRQLASLEPIAPPSKIDLAVKALVEFGVQPKPEAMAEPSREELLLKSLEQLGTLPKPEDYEKANRIKIARIYREVASELDRRIDMRTIQQLLKEPGRISGWARRGRFQKCAGAGVGARDADQLVHLSSRRTGGQGASF
jgi:hypothetical protein